MLANHIAATRPTAGQDGSRTVLQCQERDCADRRQGAQLDAARHVEVMLGRIRFAVAILAVMMAAARPGFSPEVALAFLLVPLIVNTWVRGALRRANTLPAMQRLGHRVLAADAAVALATYLTFLDDPHALPAAFVPLLIFEIALRLDGWKGIAGGAAIFTTALAVRVSFQLWVIPGGALRWPLLLVWVLLAALILVLSRELRRQARLRLAAQYDRDRIAESFQTVVGEVLTRSGVPPQAATWDDVLAAVRRLCDEQPVECATLAGSIADLLVPATRDFGLTRREREIVNLLADGYSYDRIARTLFISASTVRNHVFNVKSKLSLSSRDEIIAFVKGQGLVPEGEVRTDAVASG